MPPLHVLDHRMFGGITVRLATFCIFKLLVQTQGAMKILHRFLVASRNRFQYYSLAGLMELMVVSVLANVTLVLSQDITSFHLQKFKATATDLSELLIQGDAALMPNASSIWLNINSQGNSTSCGSLLYAHRVQFRHWSPPFAIPAIASFQTSFTFAISGRNSGGFTFLLSPTNSTSGSGGGSMCILRTAHNGDPSNHILAVEFDTWKNLEFGDPSDNHVGVNFNSMNSTATFNFCGDGVEKCEYFVTERDFTAWVDYDAEQRTLEVRVAVGDDDVVLKPEQAIIHVAELDLSAVVKDYMWVGFSGSQSLYPEIHKIKAWRFATGPFHIDYAKHAHVLIQAKIVEMVVGIAAACAILIAVAVVVHRVLHGKWGCISCDYSDVRVMPTRRDSSDGIERA